MQIVNIGMRRALGNVTEYKIYAEKTGHGDYDADSE